MATGAVMRSPDEGGTYSYSSQPHTVHQRNKYRDQDTKPANIMYDRRVIRGNTYAITTLPANTQKPPTKLQQQQHQEREAATQRRIRHRLRPITPPAVDGRRHTEVQTELYLEEITDRVEEADIQTQTDAFLDRPPTPLFIPAKTGIDATTQIEEGDLFDFDLEVQPILEVLVGKTVEQALLEVMEEEELAALREQQREFEENRNAELVETQRLEEQERRRKEEKEGRMDQQRKALIKEKETAEKIAARAFAQSYLADLVPAVFTTLIDHGFFYDRVERDVEADFLPWLMAETKKAMDRKVVARLLLDAMIRSVVKQKLNVSTSSSTPIPIETSDENTANPTEADSQEEYGVVKEKDDTEAESKILSDSVPATTNDPAGDQEEKGSEKEDAEDNKLKDGNTPETDDRLPETGEPPEMQANEEVEDNIEADGDGADQTTKETPKTAVPPSTDEEGDEAKPEESNPSD